MEYADNKYRRLLNGICDDIRQIRKYELPGAIYSARAAGGREEC